MYLYRICKAIYADSLVASGVENRWNSAGKFVIYAAGSASLACLENLVHTSGQLLQANTYKLMVIDVPEKTAVDETKLAELDADWRDIQQMKITRAIGDAWYDARRTLLMRIPSAIIPVESNYLINAQHPEINRLKIISAEDFRFDKRLTVR